MKFYKVWMIELVEKNNFSESSLGISGMLECIEDFFQGHNLTRFFVGHFPDMPIGSATNLLDQAVSSQDMGLDFFAHFLCFKYREIDIFFNLHSRIKLKNPFRLLMLLEVF